MNFTSHFASIVPAPGTYSELGSEFVNGFNDLKMASDKQSELLASIFEQTKPRTLRRLHDASSIQSQVRRQYLNFVEVPVAVRQRSGMKTYNDKVKSTSILTAVKHFTTTMINLAREKKSDEVKFVQPEVASLFQSLLQHTKNRHHFELERERPYNVEFKGVLDDRDVIHDISGKTDHCVKIRNMGLRVLTVEDKAVQLSLTHQNLSQAQCEMIFEVEQFNKGCWFPYIPEEFVGILHNGCDWQFLFRRLVRGNAVWNNVIIPPTFIDDNLNRNNCLIVAKFLEHALFTADFIADVLFNPPVVTASLRPPSIDEDHKEGDSDSRDESSQNDDPEPPTGDKQISRPKRNRDEKAKKPSGSGTGGVIGALSAGEADDMGKENYVLPLTKENVKSLSTSYFKILS